MSDAHENGAAENLQRLFETIDVANLLTEPLTESIRNLLNVSASEIDSDEASVLVRDGSEGDLRFLIATGKVADQLMTLKIPAGKGIAGFVLSSGQPMAVADVGEEESFYAEVDKRTGFSTQTLLATPLRHDGEVIGVLEYVNRRGEPPFEAFTSDEMDKAALFAEAIASLVYAYQSAKLLHDLGDKMLDKSGSKLDTQKAREWLAGLRDSPKHREMMDLAVLVREIASRGDSERRMCREILEAVLRFSDGSSDTSFLG